ncbi:MAG TPA: N-6 DNA methylase [Gemmatimonadales bacterium]|nr:N-6 DNA methylase [Gemmatimonadales bacterium]
MHIEDALRRCTTLSDCPTLVEAIGGERRYAPIAPEVLGLRGRSPAAAAADIGRLGPVPCVAITGPEIERTAARLARSAMARGAPTLVVGIGGPEGPLTFAIGADPVSTLRLDPAAPDGVALAALRRLRRAAEGGRMGAALRIAAALGGQRVDRRFFEAFRRVRDRFADEGPHGAPGDDRRALALLHLTRVLFLYFVQQKGWLDGREDFLARAVDDHLRRGRQVDRDLLRPLFFGTLNRPEALRGRAVRRFGRVPFLNGGLFEPHRLERRWPLPRANDSWRLAFDELFERFHFTLSETGDPGAIAPDMLGRVFEGLMAVDERSASGTYYTPRRLVGRIVAAAATSLVAERLGVTLAAAEELAAARDPAAGLVLSRSRVLDPAVGSGAFLLGALDLLADFAARRDPVPGVRRRILKAQLFGVDQSAEAVRLAELRLWLAAVQDDPDGPDTAVDPLPNLDAALRQGDSLHDPRWLAGLRRVPVRSARALAEARRLFAAESGPGKRGAWRALRAAELDAAAESLAEAGADIERRISAILADGRSPDLFGQARGLDRELRTRLTGAREDRKRIREAARRLAREGALPWFDAPSAFGEVFAGSGGFDLVVGNPPWVRGERIPARVREGLAARYAWWRGGGGPFAHRPDLSVAFLERSLELTAPGGVLAMLVPAKIATANYGAATREALATRHCLDRVADLTRDEEAVFEAVTYPMALVARKRAPLPGHHVGLALAGTATEPQAALGRGPWILRAPEAGAIAAALRRRHAALGRAFEIHLGVKCGCNAAFLRPPREVTGALIRPAVRGRDIRPFGIRATTPLLYPHDAHGRPRGTLPDAAFAHLAQFRTRLEQRSDLASGGPWWGLHRTRPASARLRVAWTDLALRLSAVALPPAVVPLNSCYFAIVKDDATALALVAWLNAAPIRALVALAADPARGGYLRFNARAVGAAPWVPEAAGDARLVAAAQAAADGKETTDAIDDTVADLLGLDATDRRVLAALA